MNKKQFLKELESRLMILEENERKDIINDYEEMIDEKGKEGKAEKEAIDSFGDIEALSKEILSSYKVNPDYGKKKVDAKKVIEEGESWIKKTASSLADWTNDFVNNIKNNKGLSVEMVFEVLIKILILLVIFAVLKIPFNIINDLGRGILRIFDPFDFALIIIWRLLVSICYLVGCVLVFFAFFKDYFKNNGDNKIVKDKKKEENKKDKKEEIATEVKKEKVVKKKDEKENGIISVIKWLIRFFVVICILIPIICGNIGLIVSFVYIVFFIIKGINVWGLFIILLGLILLGFESYNIVYTLTFKKIKIHVWTLIIGAVLTALGGILFIDNIMSFNYYEIPSPNIGEMAETNFEAVLTENTSIDADEVIVDDTLEDNKIRIEVSYYDEYYTVVQENLDDNNRIKIYTLPKDSDFNVFKKVYKVFLKDLKKNSVYDYSAIDNYTVVVYANSNTIGLINN